MTKPALDLRREDFPDLQGPRLDKLLRALNAYGAATSQALGGSLAGDGWFSRDVTFTARDEWTAASLVNGWANYGTPYDFSAGYRREGGIVHLRGIIKSGTLTAEAFVLPAAYRPDGEVQFATISAGALGHLVIEEDGSVVPYSGNNSDFWLNVSFRTAAEPVANPCFPVRFKNDLPAKPSHVLVAGGWIVGNGGTETPTVLGPAAWSESRGEIVIHDLGNVLSGTKYRARMLVLR